MSLNSVTFVKGQGSLGRPLPGKDHISGMVFYIANGSLPSGFSTTDRIKRIFGIDEAVALGIDNTYADETKAKATWLATNAGAAGDLIAITWAEFPTVDNPTGVVNLGTYTVTAADTTVNLLAASVSAFINAGSLVHGYTASVNTATVSIIARKGLGIHPNTGSPVTVTPTGTVAGTLTQPSAATVGVASLKSTWHYHISEYFRMQPKGDLFLAFYAVPGTYDFTDLVTIQQYAQGEIRQFAVYCNGTTYTSGKVQAAQAVATTLESQHMPCQIVVTFNYAAATLSTMADLSGLASKNVSVVIGQDGFAKGYALYKGTGFSITNLGCVLGAISLAKVSEDIAWLGKFNLSDGTENNVAAFANGALFSAQTASLLSTLNDYRYIFLVKEIGYTGTFANDSHTCILQSSDYAYIENNRTIDKAIRLLRIGILPNLAGPLKLNADGTLTNTTIASFTSDAETSIDSMVRDEELSDKQVIISTTQDVLTTSKLVIGVELMGIGVARNITVNIKYVQSLS